MKMSFLNYYKTVLEKVSFDRRLFKKEYEKALRTLTPDEVAALENWIERKSLHILGKPQAGKIVAIEKFLQG